ncbi:centrosomal protein 55 [Cricetulus griseus]
MPGPASPILRLQAPPSPASSRLQAPPSPACLRLQTPPSPASSRLQTPPSPACLRLQAPASPACLRLQAPPFAKPAVTCLAAQPRDSNSRKRCPGQRVAGGLTQRRERCVWSQVLSDSGLGGGGWRAQPGPQPQGWTGAHRRGHRRADYGRRTPSPLAGTHARFLRDCTLGACRRRAPSFRFLSTLRSKSDTALEKFKGEIAAFKTSLDEITSGKGKVTDRDKCRLLESVPANCFNSSMSSIHEKEMQLKDALEKNQQWLVYDQQREAYVKGLLAKIFELEKRKETAATLLPQQMKKTESEGYLQEEKKKYDHLLENAKKDLEVERQTVTQLRSELDEFRRKYEETQKEVEDLNQLLSSQRKADIEHLEEDRHKTEKIQRLREESSIFKGKLEEERKKSEELLSQVRILYESLLKHQEEQTRVALLEQQVLTVDARKFVELLKNRTSPGIYTVLWRTT